MKRIIIGALLAATAVSPALANHWRGDGDGYDRGYYRERHERDYYRDRGYYGRPAYSCNYSYGYARPYYRPAYNPYYYAPPVYYAPRPVVVAPAYGYYDGYPASYAYGGYEDYAPAYAYRGSGYRCRSSGAGAVLGAIAGGLIGNSVSGYYDRGFGTVAGAGVGAVIGDSVERSC